MESKVFNILLKDIKYPKLSKKYKDNLYPIYSVFLKDYNQKQLIHETQDLLKLLFSHKDFHKLSKNERKLLIYTILFIPIENTINSDKLIQKEGIPRFAYYFSSRVRELLWKNGFSGKEDLRNLRETLSFYLKFFTLPLWQLKRKQRESVAQELESLHKVLPDFSIRGLKILSETVFKYYKSYKNLEQDKKIFKKINKKISKKKEDKAWGEIVLMAGLPASGKSTFIKNNYPNLPIVSLDDIREEFDISPEGDQSEVVAIARKRAKDLLKAQTPFIWDATNLTPSLRKKQIDFFKKYGANTNIVYLETEYEKLLDRNEKRDRTVPKSAIESMVTRIVPPLDYEAHNVNWIRT